MKFVGLFSEVPGLLRQLPESRGDRAVSFGRLAVADSNLLAEDADPRFFAALVGLVVVGFGGGAEFIGKRLRVLAGGVDAAVDALIVSLEEQGPRFACALREARGKRLEGLLVFTAAGVVVDVAGVADARFGGLDDLLGLAVDVGAGLQAFEPDFRVLQVAV